MKRLLLLLVLPLAIIANAFSQKYADYQDVVYLKNGSIIRGIVIEQIPLQSLKIEAVGGSVFVFSFDEIEKITKEQKNLPEPEAKPERKENVTNVTPNTGLKKGYRGIVEMGPALPLGITMTIINGYQFNPHLSLGLGTGLNFYIEEERISMPLFADLRVSFLDKRVSPYIAMNLGYSFDLTNDFEPSGLLFLPMGGVRFKFSEKMSMNIGLGFGIQGYRYDTYDYGYDYDYYYGGTQQPNGRKTGYDVLFNFRVGFAF